MRTLASRRTAPVALLAAAALLLAGCGGGGDSSSKDKDTKSTDDPTSSATAQKIATGQCQERKAGKASDGVKVTGDFGKSQTATFDKPLESDDLERTVVTKGTGASTKAGDEVETLVTAYTGKDGKSLGSTPLTLTVADKSLIDAFSAAIECVPFGSRVVVAVPAIQMYGPDGNAQAGIKGDDTVVLVVDVIKKKVPLKPAAWTKNVPTVTFDKAGKPTLKLVGPPAKDLMLKVLKPGSGEVVKSGDQVTVDYQGTDWNTKKIFDQSYGKQPVPFKTTEVVQGFGAALVGQKVGTRLVVTIPAQYGYGPSGGNSSAGIGPKDVIVFVVEIKAVAAG
ncbi:MAG: FKBP-type peptidyl-prolyl cis-trans isomerase [Nocardioidaceae bacterium]|nr:FKBP-type peptidyl-prolyl cis-trans isomerase [Nocardioidaceae bacterium]